MDLKEYQSCDLLEHQTQRVPCAAEDAGLIDLLQRDHRQFGDGGAVERDFQRTDLTVLRDRCNQGIVTRQYWLDLGGAASRYGHIDIVIEAHLDLALRTLPDIGVVDRLA